MNTQRNETIVFIIRQTGWTLEYVRGLPLRQLIALRDEMAYQQSVDNYQRLYGAALVAAVLASGKHHQVKPEDIIGPPPERPLPKKEGGETLWSLMKQAGLRPPRET